MNIPDFQFPTDRRTVLFYDPNPGISDPSLLALVIPSAAPGMHYVAIVNDSARYWRFVRGPATVHSARVWQWLGRVDPQWLNAPWCISDDFRIATNPDEIVDRFAKTGTANTNPKP